MARADWQHRDAPLLSYATFRALSFDVVLAAVSCGWMAQVHFKVELPDNWLIVLALSVWTVYTADHLIDARRMGPDAQMYRHRLHHRFFKGLVVLAAVAGLLAFGWVYTFMGSTMLTFGKYMAVLAGFYLVIGRGISSWVYKELGVAAIFSIGVWGLPMLASGEIYYGETYLPVAAFFCACLVNLTAFSYRERMQDTMDNQPSIARSLGDKGSIMAAMVFGLIGVGLSLFYWDVFKRDTPLLAIQTAVILAQLSIFLPMAWMTKRERYRIIGDTAFCLPAIYVLLTR